MVSKGHRQSDVVKYTPRQIAAWLEFAAAREFKERAMMLGDNAMAAQGAGKDIKKQIKDWTK